MKKAKFLKAPILYGLCLCLAAGAVWSGGVPKARAEGSGKEEDGALPLSGVQEGTSRSGFSNEGISYADYLEAHAGTAAGAEAVLLGTDALAGTGADVTVLEEEALAELLAETNAAGLDGGTPENMAVGADAAGSDEGARNGMYAGAGGTGLNGDAWTTGALLFRGGDSYAEYSLDLNADGMYYLSIEYAATEETSRNPDVKITVNGEIPFREAGEMDVPRIFRDSTSIRTDSVGNEVAPRQTCVYGWQRHTLMNTNGYYDGAYRFYLPKGKNTLRIQGSGAAFLLRGVELVPAREAMGYEAYLEETAGAGGKDTSGVLVKIQAESALYKSDSVLYPNYDRVNLATEDSAGQYNNAKYIRINTMGGSLWNTSGQWISWQVEAPEDGYYNLGCRFRQNYLDGLFTSRTFYIDGEIPFGELGRVAFPYDDEWQNMVLSDENGSPYKVYLTKGTHEIRMMCTMGDFADTLRQVNDCVYQVNDLYRQIIMITGTSPDPYTDYFLEDRIPGLMDIMKEARDTLAEQTDTIVKLVGGRGSKTAILETLKVQLDSFIEEPEEIPLRLSGFKDNISAVGSWLVDIQSQGLLLDYLYLKSPDVEAPKDETNFFSNTGYSIKRFFASFDDSVYAGDSGEGPASVTVWLNSASTSATGRDQAQIIKDMIDEDFTPQTGIRVDLQLVQGSLIEATLAGMGPDVALMVAEDQPVNFAIRGALQDLTAFPDYEQVVERFYDSSVLPFWYEGGLYALPDTQVFNMLFYRTDVFEELGIRAPETWEEFYAILPVIQRNNLQITVQDIFPALYLQNGGSYYSEDQTKALLDSQEAIDAMATYTDLYVKYGFEIKTDFYSRFRSGELVMSVQPYNMYNQLMVAAPEINGLWAMAPIPGVEGADGQVNNSQNAAVTGSVMLDSCKDKDAAWEFMKWWADGQVKAKYAVALEGILGASARFTPANKDTLALLPWSGEEVETLTRAWENVIGIPQLPGSYYTARGLTNAFRSIVYNGDFPRYAMRVQNKYINEEITRKRQEFGLSTGMGETE